MVFLTIYYASILDNDSKSVKFGTSGFIKMEKSAPEAEHPVPPPRKSLNSSRENTPKKKSKLKNPTFEEFTIENFVNQVS